MTTLNRRSFLKKSSFLPFLATLATGFTPRGQARAEDILFARRLPRDFSPNRTHIFYLNSRGRDRLDRYTVYEPPSATPSTTCATRSPSGGTPSAATPRKASSARASNCAASPRSSTPAPTATPSPTPDPPTPSTTSTSSSPDSKSPPASSKSRKENQNELHRLIVS